MPNGVELNVLDAGDNEVIRIDVMMAGGLWRQTQPLQALFTNRMLREGTKRMTTAEIAEKLDYYGAWLELSNGMEYSYVTLYSLNKYLPQTLEVMEAIIKEPAFPEKELGIVVENNLRQFLVNMSKVDFLAHRSLMKAVLGTRDVLGQVVEEEDFAECRADGNAYVGTQTSGLLEGQGTGDAAGRIFRKQADVEHPGGKGIYVQHFGIHCAVSGMWHASDQCRNCQ